MEGASKVGKFIAENKGKLFVAGATRAVTAVGTPYLVPVVEGAAAAAPVLLGVAAVAGTTVAGTAAYVEHALYTAWQKMKEMRSLIPA